MPRTKLRKFQEIESHPRIIEPSKPHYHEMKKKWHEFFGNQNPIVLEIACGYGEYTNGLAQVFPNKNFIGVDIKGERLWRGVKNSEHLNLTNTAFLRTDIQNLKDFFDDGEVDEIWIVHPDPFHKTSQERKRLTHPRYLELYKQIAKKDSIFHFKTDNKELFEFSLKHISALQPAFLESTTDLHSYPLLQNHHGIQTRYEKKALQNGGSIYYITWSHQPQR